MTEKESRRIAELIADALFTNTLGDVADRIALKVGKGTIGDIMCGASKEHDLGGWCRKSTVTAIAKVLQETEDQSTAASVEVLADRDTEIEMRDNHIKQLKIALADAICSPMRIEPESAKGLVSIHELIEAAGRLDEKKETNEH